MADFSTSNLIVSVSPDRFKTGVLTNQPIVVTFLRDMRENTFNDSTIALEVVGTVARVPVSLSYANRVLTITPTNGLLPATTYKLSIVGDTQPASDIGTSHIRGVLDILGDGMSGIFTTEFSTASSGVPGTPLPQVPLNQSSIVGQPTFSWSAITCDHYEIQVSKSNTFETTYWPQQADNVGPLTATSIAPASAFDINTEYWWRVRAITANVPGAWSARSNFFYGNPSLGVVNAEDEPLGFPRVPQPVSVYAASPAPGTADLKVNPTSITVSLTGTLNTSAITAANLTVYGEAVDGAWDPVSSIPSFAPSLNGSMLGSGGITYPAQVDTFQQIKESGMLVDASLTAAVSVLGDGTSVTKLTLTPTSPSTYFQPNNRYTVTLDLPELAAPLVWTFTTKYSPLFTSVSSVREWIDNLYAGATPPDDDKILYKIRHNSLYALFLQVYPPTHMDGESWIYDAPVSFNANNPPFFVRKYVELKTAHDFLTKKFWGLLGGGKTQLGDFSVDSQNAALTANIKLAYDNLQAELLPLVDKLHGHTNRGYARAAWSVRGSGRHGGANSPGGYVANDNSYLWPRTSKPQF